MFSLQSIAGNVNGHLSIVAVMSTDNRFVNKREYTTVKLYHKILSKSQNQPDVYFYYSGCINYVYRLRKFYNRLGIAWMCVTEYWNK